MSDNTMKTHNIKLLYDFVDAVYSGEKPFEVRKNDRGYQKGDYICFMPILDNGEIARKHPIVNKRYVITYVLSGWGIEQGYVVLGIKEVTDNE